MMLWTKVGVLLVALGCVRPARILALFPLNARSHFYMFSALLQDLTLRGHHVTLLGHFPLSLEPDSYTFLDVSDSMVQMDNTLPLSWVSSLTFLDGVQLVFYENEAVCDILGHTHAQSLLHSQDTYDLIITELFSTDCFLGFPYKLQVPFIVMTSSVMMPWGNDRFGNPDHPAYIPNYFLPYTDHMTFWQRTVNTVVTTGAKILHRVTAERASYAAAKIYFGEDLPALSEIARNASLVLVNSHFSVNQPRPLVPGVVEVGGLHLPEPKDIPKELEEFVSGAEEGVIFFSLGSIFDAASLPEAELSALLSAFSSLPYRVLWKISALPVGTHRPPNVLIRDWLPQFDLLSHPNTRLFITHGGLMSTQEAVHAGVPMLGIPLFADQHLNMAKYEREGVALSMSYEDITEEVILEKIKTLLGNNSYAEKARQLSRVFRDRPLSARQTAVYWTEYVLRQDGARHLRAQAAVLPTSTYLLLDVQEVILGGIIVLVVVCYTAFKHVVAITVWVIGWPSRNRGASVKKQAGLAGR